MSLTSVTQQLKPLETSAILMDQMLWVTQTFQFRWGDRSLQDMQRTGRPESLDREDLKAAVDADPFLKTRELANTFDCSPSTILHGLRDIGKVNKRGRWLPHKLTENNKNQRSTTCFHGNRKQNWGARLGSVATCAVQPWLGAIRLSLVQVNGTLITWCEIARCRTSQKLGRWLFCIAAARVLRERDQKSTR